MLNEFTQRTYTVFILGILFFALFFLLPSFILSWVLLGILGGILFIEWPRVCPLSRIACWLLIPLYPVLPFVALILMNHPVYRTLLMLLFITVFAGDLGGYLVGKLFGNHPIAPSISPKKTWEGLAGSMLLATLCLSLSVYWSTGTVSLGITTMIATITSIIATLGDFFESWLKRNAGIKDSGSLLPGHGGLLDRFDSSMSVGLVWFVAKNLLNNLLQLH